MKNIKKYQEITESFRQDFQEWIELNDIKLSEMYKDEKVTGTLLWKFLDNEGRTEKVDKNKLKTSLLKEQGYICCYCGDRINELNSHVEHIAPKNEYKNLTYDYQNLLMSCNGGCKNIIHFVKDNEETKEIIAEYYGVNSKHIEELYIDDTNFDLVKKSYNLDELQKGDKILILKKVNQKERHCGMKKDKDIMYLCPLNKAIETYFIYNANNGEIEFVKENEKFNGLINITLGLNDNILLLDRRKDRIEKALTILTSLINIAREKKIDIKQLLLKKKMKMYQNEILEPFCFLEVAVLENRVKAI